MSRVCVTDHAAERYQERVKPALTLDAARSELIRLLRTAPRVQRPDWQHESPEDPDAYAEISDGIVVPLMRTGNRFTAATVLIRAAHSDAVRERRNQRKADRRYRRSQRKRREARRERPLLYEDGA